MRFASCKPLQATARACKRSWKAVRPSKSAMSEDLLPKSTLVGTVTTARITPRCDWELPDAAIGFGLDGKPVLSNRRPADRPLHSRRHRPLTSMSDNLVKKSASAPISTPRASMTPAKNSTSSTTTPKPSLRRSSSAWASTLAARSSKSSPRRFPTSCARPSPKARCASMPKLETMRLTLAGMAKQFSDGQIKDFQPRAGGQ